MSIRLPLTTVLDVTHTDQGAGSIAGGWAYPFKITQDTDNVVVKFTPSVTAGGVSVIFQTSDDGGNTYYDVARTSIASQNELGKAVQWLSVPTITTGLNPNVVVRAGSVLGGAIGSASASTLGSQQVSGMPVLGMQNRIFLITSGNATAVSGRIQVMVNQQSSSGQ